MSGYTTPHGIGPLLDVEQHIIHESPLSSQSIIICQLVVKDPNGDQPTAAQMSGGAITIYRYRQGTDADWTAIVSAAAMTENVGEMVYAYQFTAANWASGDLIQIHNAAVTVTRYGKTLVQGPFRYMTKMP